MPREDNPQQIRGIPWQIAAEENRQNRGKCRNRDAQSICFQISAAKPMILKYLLGSSWRKALKMRHLFPGGVFGGGVFSYLSKNSETGARPGSPKRQPKPGASLALLFGGRRASPSRGFAFFERRRVRQEYSALSERNLPASEVDDEAHGLNGGDDGLAVPPIAALVHVRVSPQFEPTLCANIGFTKGKRSQTPPVLDTI